MLSIILGVLFYFTAMWVGEALIAKFAIAPDAELKEMVEKISVSGDPASLSDSEKEELRLKLFSNKTVIGSGMFLFLGMPLLIGLVIGFVSKGVLEGAASMGLSAVVFFVMNGSPAMALWALLGHSALGALGALGGTAVRSKIG